MAQQDPAFNGRGVGLLVAETRQSDGDTGHHQHGRRSKADQHGKADRRNAGLIGNERTAKRKSASEFGHMKIPN
jgi:hypothetical protein